MPPAGVFGKAANPAFTWHDAAALIGPDGVSVPGQHSFVPLVADTPATVAIATVLAGGGRAFRIAGTGPLEAGAGCFETLTGGSLGAARRVVRSQASWIASFAVNARLFGIGPGVSVAVPGGLAHSLALYAALEGLYLGAEVHLLDGMRPDRQARAVAERRIEVIYATPPHLAQMVASVPDWRALRQVVVGGAKLEPALRATLAAIAPTAQVHEFYGAAETSFITLAAADADEGAVGWPYPGVEIALRGPDGGDLPDGQAGAVWVRSPYLFQRYVGADPGGAVWQDGWLTVGEVGRWTAAGLVLSGRAGRMVTIAAQNVFAEEVERFMAALPGVDRVAVLAVRDDRRGHVLWAVLSGDRGQEAAILQAARARLGPVAAPRRVIWRDDWPVLASGKTDLGVLQAEVAEWR